MPSFPRCLIVIVAYPLDRERLRIIVEAWTVLLTARVLGCFIFNWLDVRSRAGPIQKGFTRKYRDPFHVNIRNGPTSFALPSQHYELADMTFRAGKKQCGFFHRYMLFRFYERELLAQLRRNVIGRLCRSLARTIAFEKDRSRNLLDSCIK